MPITNVIRYEDIPALRICKLAVNTIEMKENKKSNTKKKQCYEIIEREKTTKINDEMLR